MIRKILIFFLIIILTFSLSLFGCRKPEEVIEKAEETVEETKEETTKAEAEELDLEESKEAAEKIEEAEELEKETQPTKGEVTFKTEDNIAINGNIFGSGDKWVILSHMYPTDQTSWFDFANFLAENGYVVLTYDFRGYGKSGGSKEISKIYIDLDAALDFIKQYEVKKLFLVGASMGGTASIIGASKEKIDGLISISAPTEFKGLSAISEIEKVNCPKLFIASKGDKFAAKSAYTFFEKSPQPKDIEILDGNAHGSFIFTEEPQNGEKLKQLILDFLNGI